jgi:hypothetical protein
MKKDKLFDPCRVAAGANAALWRHSSCTRGVRRKEHACATSERQPWTRVIENCWTT